MMHAGNQRTEVGAVRSPAGGERQRTHGPAMKGAVKGDRMLPLGMIARELEGRLDGLGAGVGEENFLVALARRQASELLGQLDHRLVVKIAAANMEKLARLLFDRFNHPRMG